MAMTPKRREDFPPGLAGGLEHDDEDHRVGETGQTGPEAVGDIDRSHPEWRGGPGGPSGSTDTGDTSGGESQEGEDRAERNAGG
jgi:hypothetical protein